MSFTSRVVAPFRCLFTPSACTRAGGRRSLAVAVAAASSNSGHLSPFSPPPATAGYCHAAVHVPTCHSIRQAQRRPLTIISPPSIIIGAGASPRVMSTSSPQYFEGPWYEKYLLLEQYKKEHGNCLVPYSFVYGNVKLGQWVVVQRRSYKNGELSKNRRVMLDALDFSFDPYADAWERNFALLEQYKQREGHCDVPVHHKEDGIRLGDWLSRQRCALNKEKLDESYQRRLEQLGVSWDPRENKWEQNFALLERFHQREGHCNVPESYEEDKMKLGKWLARQRQVKRGHIGGNLDLQRIERLEKLGVLWDPYGDEWERNFALLEHFKEQKGHCNVPKSYEEDGIRLGEWIGTQRTAMKRGKLDESYEYRLDALGVSWDPHGDQWERNFALLEQYKKRQGHCNAPQSHEEEGVKLGAWLSNQRRRRGKMEESYQHRLEQLGVIWEPLEDQWERNFALLKQFKEREGHYNVPQSHEEGGINLGKWLDWQRQVRKGNVSGNLSTEQIGRLDELGIRW